MGERDYGAWLGVRAIGGAVTRTSSADLTKLRDYLRGEDFALGGFKGVGLSFRPWNQQMRQPVLLVNKRVLVSVLPQPGFLHPRTPLDRLGYDHQEVAWALQCSDEVGINLRHTTIDRTRREKGTGELRCSVWGGRYKNTKN